jgi:anthranilate synthase/aminodeoxychorismate synthase-like glutamine amidotransferase
MKTLIIDNYDSFTFNLFQYVAAAGGHPEVRTNDGVSVDEIERRQYTHIIISPGPGTAEKTSDFGICREVILNNGQKTPLLGVCLGHQGIAHAFGAKIMQAPSIMHGKKSPVTHTGGRLFAGIPSPFEAMRYHSLCVSPSEFPSCLDITARSPDDDTIMALEHGNLPLFGIQFHPESFGTPEGKKIITNFLNIAP